MIIYVNLHHVEYLNFDFSSLILWQLMSEKKRCNSQMSKNESEMD